MKFEIAPLHDRSVWAPISDARIAYNLIRNDPLSERAGIPVRSGVMKFIRGQLLRMTLSKGTVSSRAAEE